MKTTSIKQSLQRLADDANQNAKQGDTILGQAHRQGARGLECYRAAGKALCKAKKKVEHKEWTDWLDNNWNASNETAQLYMRIARFWDQGLSDEVKKGDVSTIREVRTFLNKDSGKSSNGRKRPKKMDGVLKALQWVKPGLFSRPLVELIDCFIFEDGNLWAYNDEVFCHIPSPLGKDITGSVKSDRLLGIVNALADEKLDVAMEGNKLVATSYRHDKNVEINIGPLPTEYRPPKLPDEKDWDPLTNADGFIEAIRIAGICAGRDDGPRGRIYTHLHICPEYVESCDDYNACRYDVESGLLDTVFVRQAHITSIPRDAGFNEFKVTDEWLHLRNKRTKFVYSVRVCAESDFENAKYPDLDKLFEGDGERLSIPKNRLMKAMDRAAVFLNDPIGERNSVTIKLEDGKLIIESHDEYGNYSERLKVKYRGKNVEFKIPFTTLRAFASRANDYKIVIGADGTATTLIATHDDFQFATSLVAPKNEVRENEAAEAISKP